MKIIFLAAGKGSRLAPLTNEVPKALVKYNGKSILDYNIDSARKLAINHIVIVIGYKREAFSYEGIKYFYNEKYASTNMVESLMCASEELDDDIIVSYSDIIYQEDILKKLVNYGGSPVSVVIDKDWEQLWSLRMEDPLQDAETLKIDSNGKIKEIGKKTTELHQIEGQYIGLMKFSKTFVPELIKFYHALDQNKRYDGQRFENMYMTSFLQLLIDSGVEVSPVEINGGWIEIDTESDLKAYTEHGIRF